VHDDVAAISRGNGNNQHNLNGIFFNFTIA